MTAGLHHQYLSVGLFPQLGAGFLRRWHRTFVAVPHGRGVVAVDDLGQVVGFALVATRADRYVEEVLRTGRWRLGAAGVAALLRRPVVAMLFARTRGRRYARRLLRRRPRPTGRGHGAPPAAPSAATAAGPRGGGGGQGEPVGPARSAVVYALVTVPAVRGRGVGRELLEAAVEAARQEGATEVCLLTRDAIAQARPAPGLRGQASDRERAGAAGFYDRLGWQRAREVERDGAALIEYRLPLR
ncbi:MULTISPECIES: GNAT family N-acetyltransferase [Actinomycetes]|uniref:GNAT family N-acetyltransferase n=2 Tax=Actinomycetota TaxID=201174 RepID=UPI00131A0359|nr:GNAT family N-acetyltransferase [Pseudokineococcus lusitanus]